MGAGAREGLIFTGVLHASVLDEQLAFLPLLSCGSGSRHRQWNPVWYVASVPVLSIGHGFGIIPAPGSFASSALPVPRRKIFERPTKIFRVPPTMQPLALGAETTRLRVPQLQGQKRRNKMYVNVVHLIGYLGRNPEHKSVRATDRKYADISLATQRSW